MSDLIELINKRMITNRGILGSLEIIRFIFDQGDNDLAVRALNNSFPSTEREELADLYKRHEFNPEEMDIQDVIDLDDFIQFLLNS